MILGFPSVQKAPQDVVTIACDWTPFLALATLAATAITAHSVAVDSEVLGAPGFGEFDFISIGTAGVVAVDTGVSGMVHSVTLSGGSLYAYSVIALSVTFNDGTRLTRCFQASVR